MGISNKLKEVTLQEDEEIISYDVVSLYTNVPVLEAIEVCTDLLFNLPMDRRPKIDKETFTVLAKIASCDVLLSTHNGFYIQRDGLAMGSPPAPHFANGWLSQFEESIRGEARLYFRYMDDILKEVKGDQAEQQLRNINNLHPNLTFTIEREQEQQLPVLDMKILHNHATGALSSTWYNKPTDTGLIMNYHALAPKRYKRSVVSGFVYRIYRACSSWENFHTSMEKARKILERNQYPPTFYEPVMRQAMSDILGESSEQPATPPAQTTDTMQKRCIMLQYRGKCSEEYARALHTH